MRIAIFGRPGSGKSTFAIKLGKALRIPVYHLDKYFFRANWQERPYDDFMLDQNKIVANSDWLIDGNSLKSLNVRYSASDIVIYFYLPMHICLLRVLKRFFSYRTIDDRAEGCPEKIDWKLIKYMWDFENAAQTRGSLNYLIQSYPGVRFYKIRSDEDARELFRTLAL